VRTPAGLIEQDFLIDRGADTSMAPYSLFRELGLRWSDGARFPVTGIARCRECTVIGRVHDVDLVIREAGILMRVPIVFVRGDAPYVLGRDVLFDALRITFDPARRRTIFELADH
jgi:hypothetical protein